MAEINLGNVRSVPDYSQNDPNGPGYIANRPCYIGPTTEVLEFENASLSLNIESYNVWPGSEPLVAGDDYKLTINNVTVTLTAAAMEGDAFVYIGDNYEELEANPDLVPEYGFILGTMTLDGIHYYVIIDTDSALFFSTFNITSDYLGPDYIPNVTLVHVKQEIEKLDRRMLPDDLMAPSTSTPSPEPATNTFKVVDMDTVSGGITDVDFSQFAVGDVILIVSSGSAASMIGEE